MFNFKNYFKMKNLNYQKEQYRGTIKQIMKVRGLRTISIANYNAWKGNEVDIDHAVHSLKIDLQDGYLNIYNYRVASTGRLMCGEEISDASVEIYKDAFNQVNAILADEHNIPTAVRKNILVRMAR